ncbi:MAG: hypothetical protein IKE64_01350 [Thermoguttaceae bacterium]|nr:hypothetical protein [Thermoguttaceae bacterium]
MSKKKKYALTAAVVIVNLLIIFFVKDWENLRSGRIIAPYREPSKSQVMKWAADIASRLNEGDIEFVLNCFDANAWAFFQEGITNWIDEETENRYRERMRTELTGVKACALEKCETDLLPPSDDLASYFYFPSHRIEYELVYEDGHIMRSSAHLFKDKWGRLGVVNFSVHKPIEPKRNKNEQSEN